MISDKEFCGSIYQQFEHGVQVGLAPISCQLPVVSLADNQITIGAKRDECRFAPHEVRLARHPSGVITASVESGYGLACPDPLAVMGQPLGEAAADMVPRNHSDLVVVASRDRVFAMGRDYGGDLSPLHGLRERHQRVFFAQIAGLVTSRALREQ